MRSGRIGDMGGEIETVGIRISILVSLSQCLQTIFTVDKSKRGNQRLRKDRCSKDHVRLLYVCVVQLSNISYLVIYL